MNNGNLEIRPTMSGFTCVHYIGCTRISKTLVHPFNVALDKYVRLVIKYVTEYLNAYVPTETYTFDIGNAS